MTTFNPIAKKLAGKFVREDWLDFVFSHVDPMLAVNRVLAEVVSISQETPDIKRFVFRPNANWKGFVAGQFMPVRVQIDGIFHERCYSLVSEPTDGLLEIGVKRQPNGKVSNWLHDHLQVGDVIELGQTLFVFRDAVAVHVDRETIRQARVEQRAVVTPVRRVDAVAIRPMWLVEPAMAPRVVIGSSQVLAACATVSISASVSARKIESNLPRSAVCARWM